MPNVISSDFGVKYDMFVTGFVKSIKVLIRCIFVLSFVWYSDVLSSVSLNQTFISETDEQRFMHRDEAGSKTRRKTKRKTPV